MRLDQRIVRLLARLPLPQGRLQVARMWIAEWLDQHTVLCRAWLMAWGVGVIPFWRIQRANGCPGGETTFCGKCWYLGLCRYDQSPAPPEDMGGEYGGGYPSKADAAATVAATPDDYPHIDADGEPGEKSSAETDEDYERGTGCPAYGDHGPDNAGRQI